MLSAYSTLLIFTHPLWSQTTRCVNVIRAIYIEASVHKLIAHFWYSKDMNIHPLRINHKESRKMDIKGTKKRACQYNRYGIEHQNKNGVFNLDFDNEQHSVRFTAV